MTFVWLFKTLYTIKLHPKVNEFLEKSEKILSERIRKKLLLLKEEPFRYLEHFEGNDFGIPTDYFDEHIIR